MGSPGLDGEDGLDGLDGATGATGAQGLMGIPGFDGVSGEDGLPGMPGIAGVKGSTGLQGVPGFDGVDGEDGIPGMPGIAGPRGFAGIMGPPGMDGDVNDFEPPIPSPGTGAFAPAQHDLLSTTHADTLVTSPVSGAIITAITGKWFQHTAPVDGIRRPLINDGAGTTAFGSLVAADLPSTVVYGTGTANRLAFWTGAQTIDDDADLTYDPTTNVLTSLGQILVRSGTSPQYELINEAGGNANFRFNVYSNTAANTPLFAARRARGTEGTPLTLSLLDSIFTINAQGHDGTAFGFGGQMRFVASQAWTGSAHGTSMFWATVANGSTTLVDRIGFDGTGNFVFQAGVCGPNWNRKTFSNAAYTALVTDHYIAQIGTMNATRAVTIPTAASAGAGHELIIKDESGTVTAVNTITFTMSGGDTTDVTTIALLNGSRTIVSNGVSRWGTVATFS